MPKRNNAPLSFVLFILSSHSLEAASGGATDLGINETGKEKAEKGYQLVKTQMKFQGGKIYCFSCHWGPKDITLV